MSSIEQTPAAPSEFEGRPRSRFPAYTRGNVAEVFPNPTSPLLWTTMVPLGTEAGWRDGLVELGAFDADEFDPDAPEVLNYFGGYLYLNLSILRVLAVRAPGMTPELMDAGLLGAQPDAPPYRAHPDDESPVHTERMGATIGRIITTEATDRPAEDRRFVDEFVASRPDLASASDADLVARLRASMRACRRPMVSHIVATMSSSIAVGLVSTVCIQALEDPELAMDLLSGLGDVASAQPSFELWEVARLVAGSPALMAEFDRGTPGLLDRLRGNPEADDFLAAFQRVIDHYPFRGPDEYNLAAATWETCPELPLAAVDRMRLASDHERPGRRNDELSARRVEREQEAVGRLADTPELAAQLAGGIKAARVFLSAREAGRINLVIPMHEGRLALRELGTRMVTRGHLDRWEDLEVLADSDLDAFIADPGTFTGTIKERAAAFAALRELEPPFVIDGVVPPTSAWQLRASHTEEPVAAGTVLQGIPGCPGRITGTARIVTDPLEPEGLGPGEILVAPLTDPAWTPLFVGAAAVVVETGATISHAVIVSRELGIPCVVSVPGATGKIKDGATITVDGLAGTVTVLD